MKFEYIEERLYRIVTINDFVLLSEFLASLSWFNATNSKRQEDISARLYDLFREIDGEEKDIILELTKNFTNITLAMLEDIIRSICSYIPQENFDNAESIYVIPIAAKKDIHKIKSCSYVSHFLKTSFEYDITKNENAEVEHLANVSYFCPCKSKTATRNVIEVHWIYTTSLAF